MTDEPVLSPDELLEAIARDRADEPAEPVADAEGLPDEVKSDRIPDDGPEDKGESPNHYEGD